jgi:hypothetical protein
MVEVLKRLLTRVTHAGSHVGLWWGLAISVGLAVASLAVAAFVVVGWSPDQFKHAERPALWLHRSAPLRALGLVGKNLAGSVLILVGVVMALPGVPGQGVLTMIIGLTLVDFPGKRAFERRLVARPLVLRWVNGLRRRFGRPPLEL